MVSTKQVVFQAIVDLCNVYPVATREAIIKSTGLKFSIVDEAVKKLREEDQTIHRQKSGHFVPIKIFDELPVTATVLDDGRAKVEHGDHVMALTPRAARSMAMLLWGYVMAHGQQPYGTPLHLAAEHK